MNSPVLVIEEDADDLFVIRRRLEAGGTGNPVVSFFDGDDAIEYLGLGITSPEQYPLPCVMFTDLKLLGSDGFSVITWIRSRPELRGIKIFILSGSENPTHRARAEDLEVDGYLIKFPTVKVFADIVASASA